MKSSADRIRQNIVVFTGAGISAESDLPTFRGNNGLWTSVGCDNMATASAFYENTKAVLDFYNDWRKQLAFVEPNKAHILLAELEKYHCVTVITQNIDNLHERAGSSNVIHLHGELTKVTSSVNRVNPDCIKEYPLEKPILIGDKAEDGSQLRPFVVWFDEYVNSNDLGKAISYIKEADIFIVIGTSLNVQPAKNLVKYAHREVPKYIIDPNEVDVPEGFDRIHKTATEGMAELIKELI